MRKILLLLLSIGFFAKPVLAQEITLTASTQLICLNTDIYSVTLSYSGVIENSNWELLNPGTGTWQFLDWVWTDEEGAPAIFQPETFGLLESPGTLTFRVRTLDGDGYLYSNEISITVAKAVAVPALILGDGCKNMGDNTERTLTVGSDLGALTNILWSTGEVTPSINVNPTVSTTYSVTATDPEGCPFYAAHSIGIYYSVPLIIQTTSSEPVCSGEPVTLTFGGFSTAPPCTLSPNGQNPANAITPGDGLTTVIGESFGHLGEYSLINVQEGKYYSFFTRANYAYSTITSADGSQVYTSGEYGKAIWRATYTGQVRFYSNSSNCEVNNDVTLLRFVQRFDNAPATFLWMPGGQTTPSITVNPQSTTTYKLTVSNVSALQFYECGGIATQQVTVVPCNPLSATCSANNTELYFGYSGDQTSTITVTPSGGVAPYNVSIKMNRPLKCNQVNDGGDEVWTGGSGGTTVNNGCPVYPNLATLAPASTKTISSGSYSVTTTLMDDADIIVTVTDANGATYTCTKHIHGEDVRCFAGKSGVTKVTLCHQTGSTKNPCISMCVDESDVAAHLAHGDFLGKCTADCKPPKTSNSLANSLNKTDAALKLYPNPNKGQFVVQLNLADKINTNGKIQLIDMMGKTVQTEYAQINNGALQKTINVSSALTKGIYMLRITINDKVYRTEMIYQQ